MFALPAIREPNSGFAAHLWGIYAPAPAQMPSRMPLFWWVGTGGLETVMLLVSHLGYQTPTVRLGDLVAEPAAPFAELMQGVKKGFGRTVSRLPEVFGVSRQTLYNWLRGETPKPAHHDKLRELAAAARIFVEAGFKPTSVTLDKTIACGKSLLELLSEGASGAEMAQRLVSLARRGVDERLRLDALLGARKTPTLEPSDMGSPSLAED